MIDDLSALKLSSAMARHAGQVHSAVGGNIARADIPNASADRVQSFADALNGILSGTQPSVSRTNTPISLDREMVAMAQNAGRHDAAVTIWSKTVELMRLAGQAPR